MKPIAVSLPTSLARAGRRVVAAACVAVALSPCSAAADAAPTAPQAAASGAPPASGAPETPPTAGSSRGPLIVAMRIAQTLELSDEQTKKLSDEMRRSAQERRAIYAKKAALESQLQAQLAQKPLDEAALRATSDRLAALDRQIALLPDALWQSIRPGLSAEQGARLLLLRDEIKRRARGERGGKRGAARGAGDGAD